MTLKNQMRPVHPGEILRDELDEIGLSSKQLASELGIAKNIVDLILAGKQDLNGGSALCLARYFGTTPQVWLNLQKTWELRTAEFAGDSKN